MGVGVMQPCPRLLENEGKRETETRLQRDGEMGRVVGVHLCPRFLRREGWLEQKGDRNSDAKRD